MIHAAVLGGKVRAMAQTRTLTPGYTVIHPNRDKPECKLVKVIVVGILVASVLLMVLAGAVRTTFALRPSFPD